MTVAVTAIIIDDEEDICVLLSSYLRKRKVEVHYAFDLKKGMELIHKYQPDLLFLDNNLPDGSGIDCIKEIRGIKPSMRIILISALTNLRELALTNGADDFIGKPISFTNIKSILESKKKGT